MTKTHLQTDLDPMPLLEQYKQFVVTAQQAYDCVAGPLVDPMTSLAHATYGATST